MSYSPLCYWPEALPCTSKNSAHSISAPAGLSPLQYSCHIKVAVFVDVPFSYSPGAVVLVRSLLSVDVAPDPGSCNLDGLPPHCNMLHEPPWFTTVLKGRGSIAFQSLDKTGIEAVGH